MSEQHVSKLLQQMLYRCIIQDSETRVSIADRFIQAATKQQVIGTLGFALGLATPRLEDVSQFETDPDKLFSEEQRKLLHSVVARMPSLEFKLLPLVLFPADTNAAPMQTFLLCVRKPRAIGTPTDTVVYVDMMRRCYDSFNEFLQANKLPSGTVWYPANGQECFDAGGELLVSSSTISNSSKIVWHALSAISSVAAFGLAFTPVGPLAALAVGSTIPLGLSIANLVDGCKHERGAVIALRSTAVVVNLVTFASVGMTVASKAASLRGALSPKQLLLLDRAESLMQATAKTASALNVTCTVIGSVAGWLELSGEEWVVVAANLCLAYREVIITATAERLFRMLQENGVLQFFRTRCPSVPVKLLRENFEQHFDGLLKLVFTLLKKEVKFTVDKQFTTLRVSGYELRFETLLRLNGELMDSLFDYLRALQGSISKLCSVKDNPFTQEVLEGLIDLLKLVRQLKDVPCQLGDYIILGRGHRLTFDTLRAWMNVPGLERIELLKALVSLDASCTERLNEIRATKLGPDGDASFFRWLVAACDNSCHRYEAALDGLLRVVHLLSEKTSDEPSVIAFDGARIVISPLVSVLLDECRQLSDNSLRMLLFDTRFQQLCHDAAPQSSSWARDVWYRTIQRGGPMRPETLSLLEQLFATGPNGSPGPLTLTEAMEYALTDDTATVESAYHSILFAWNVLAKHRGNTAFDRAATMARFQQLMSEAASLQMAQSIPVSCPTESKGEEPLIAAARMLVRFIKYGPECGTNLGRRLYFGTRSRAAFWLHLLPALRSEAGRDRFNATVRYLVKSGEARVLHSSAVDPAAEAAARPPGEYDSAEYVLFSHGKNKVMLEMVPTFHSGWSASVYLFSFSFKYIMQPVTITTTQVVEPALPAGV